MTWSKGYDWLLGPVRVTSASTMFDGRTQHILFKGYGGVGPPQDHLYFTWNPKTGLWGGTQLKSGGRHDGQPQSLASEPAHWSPGLRPGSYRSKKPTRCVSSRCPLPATAPVRRGLRCHESSMNGARCRAPFARRASSMCDCGPKGSRATLVPTC